MTTTLIIGIALGLLTYWLTKMQGEIKSPSEITSYGQFLSLNLIKISLSIVGAVLIVLNGVDLPFGMGKLDGIVPAFIAGGSIPSMINNISALFKKSA